MDKVLMDLWTLAQPILFALSAFAAAWISMKLSRFLDAHNATKLQDQLRQAMMDATSTVYQRSVKGLKDPTHPGSFDREAQQKAAKEAIDLVLGTHRQSVDKLKDYGVNVDKLLEQLVERAVIELDTKITGTLAAPGTTIRASSSPQPTGVVVIPSDSKTEVLTVNAAAADVKPKE